MIVAALVFASISCGYEPHDRCPDGYRRGADERCVLDPRHIPCDCVDALSNVGCCAGDVCCTDDDACGAMCQDGFLACSGAFGDFVLISDLHHLTCPQEVFVW